MDSATGVDYRLLISKLIKKQLLILGPDITFLKVKNVNGLTVDSSGEIIGVVGSPKTIFENLSSQFISLSSSVVKQTLDSLHESSGSTDASNKSNEAASNSNNQNSLEDTSSSMPNSSNIASGSQNVEPAIVLSQGIIDTKVKEPPKFSIEEIERLNKELDELSRNLAS